MGVSTDGVLFYGYVWDDEHDIDSEEAEELWSKDEPVLVGHHGSDKRHQPYIYVQASKITAYRGYPRVIDPAESGHSVLISWDVDLKAFVDRFGIDVSDAQGPGWFLVSWWG